MITTADAMEIMLVVQRCHPRTAPRMDDPDVNEAIASMWAELFNEYRLEYRDLETGVKKRALHEREAPEPAEIITFARASRRERDERTGPTPEYQTLCESKAEDAQELANNRARLAAMLNPIARQKSIDA